MACKSTPEEESQEESQPKTVEERLVEAAACFSEQARSKISKYWEMTSYKGPGITAADIRTVVKPEIKKIEITAKCLMCLKFIKLNMVDLRTFSIKNYKTHASRHHVKQPESRKKLKVASGSQTQISKFFTVSQEKKTNAYEASSSEALEVSSEEDILYDDYTSSDDDSVPEELFGYEALEEVGNISELSEN
jgi:hypothetical protein